MVSSHQNVTPPGPEPRRYTSSNALWMINKKSRASRPSLDEVRSHFIFGCLVRQAHQAETSKTNGGINEKGKQRNTSARESRADRMWYFVLYG
ncbi:hypothetical protein RRG08_040364 [Elysia crispata]|uniref:Uncharacterized protein n=1 Tax=Elysia crispata TaxID=231223 RepID=A0AAE1DQU1_9GAST|nr:hypothetical protein RRG08_040364 [Elysia crispata]